MIRILYPDAAGVLDVIELMVIEGGHGLGAVPTEHPVEDGATITDHIRPELDTYSARCLVTNTLLEPAGSHMGGVVPATFDVDGVTMAGWSDLPDRVKLVFVAVVELMQARRPVTIETPMRRYEQMAVTRITWPETADDGVEFSLEAKQVRIVTTRTVAATQPREVRGRRRANGGTVTTQVVAAPPPAPAPRDQSYLVRLFN